MIAHAAPPLSAHQAAVDVRRLVRDEYDARARVTRCRRSSASRRVCTVRWDDGFRVFSGTIAIRRSDPAISPVDDYAIRAVTGRRHRLSRQRLRDSGRVVIETRRAGFGQILRLLGPDIDRADDVEVAVGPPTDNAPYSQLERPPGGTRFVAYPIAIRNRGVHRAEEALGYGARLVLVGNRTLSSSYVSSCNPPELSVAPGEGGVGCVAFAVPYGAPIDHLEYRADSGTGQETGVWR